MTIMPFMNERARSSSAPLDSRLPVVSRPTWCVYEVRSKSWSEPPNTISTCSTVATVALEPVVDAAADEPRPELGERPMERGALADDRVAVLEGDGRWRAAPGGWRLRARASRARRTSSVPARNDWPPSSGARPGRSSELLEDGRGRALAERDERPREERPIGGAGVPADDDRASEADAGRDVEHDALAPQRAGQLGEPVVGRQDRAAVEQRADPLGSRRREIGDRRSASTPAAVASARKRDRRSRSPSSTTRRPSRALGQRRPSTGAVRGDGVRAGRRPAGPCAGRCRSCTAGSTRRAAPRRRRSRPADRRASQAVLTGEWRDRRRCRPASPGSVKSVSPWRAGRGRGDATVIRATPPSRA